MEFAMLETMFTSKQSIFYSLAGTSICKPITLANSFFFLFLFVFSFTDIHESQDFRGGAGYFFNSSLPLPAASQTLRHQPGDYYRELTSAHGQQPDSNREPNSLFFYSTVRKKVKRKRPYIYLYINIAYKLHTTQLQTTHLLQMKYLTTSNLYVLK